jgi:predicted metalloprotease
VPRVNGKPGPPGAFGEAIIGRVFRLLASVAVIAALVVAGCSSSERSEVTEGEPDTTTTSTTTTVTVETGRLDDLPVVAPASESTRPPSSGPGLGRNTFLREVFDDVQSLWRRDFTDGGIGYTPARLTIFTNVVHSACGTQSAQVGPFYCPADRGVYLDTRFFDVLARRVGVNLGDFARAYVVAHEVAHHVQFLLGISRRIATADMRDPAGKNARSIRFELQADCLAGVWIHSRYERGELTQSDMDDALNAAAVVGSDFQQLSATGMIRPEDWTHGSSSQRRHWLTIGFDQGKPGACDTFTP